MLLQAYRLLAWCALVPLLAHLWWRGRRDTAYRERWHERLGFPSTGTTGPPGAVLLHCASVGEVIAARPLVERLLGDASWGPVLVTCSTPTGSRQILRDFGQRVGHCYFPLDLPGATRRFLSRVRPRLVLLMERELWPEFLHQAQCRGVPVVLVNARLSGRSAAGYRRWHGLMAPALATLRLVCAGDADTAQRLRALGVRPERLRTTGNIKSDVRATAALVQAITDTRGALGTRPVLTAGSTHAGEDEALLAAFARHLLVRPDTLLILVPRHPERFDVVAALLGAAGLRHARRSRGQPLQADTQVLLGDTMGELMHWYGVADACFIGGSLVPRGGHNPMEALCLDKPVLTGPHTANFDTLFRALEDADALGRVADADAVFAQLRLLLQDPALRHARVAAARKVYRDLSGALDRTLDALQPWARPGATDGPPRAPHRACVADTQVWADPAVFGRADLATLFELDGWGARGSADRFGAGRGHIHRVADARGSYLMRHYYRGGWMARISRDLFLARPVATSRAMQEFTLLRTLRSQGLPVPRACAARYTAVALAWYRADILVELIPDARDTARLMHGERALTPSEWQSLGRTVRRLHDAQVFHSDLNCHNLLLDARGQAWIVDFDKCGFRAGESWKQANLERLRRSLRKELRLDPTFRWDEGQWTFFADAYRSA